MSAGTRLLDADVAWESGPEEIVLGVDIIELVTSSMYVEPLAAYREYVQNAADAIDDARERGLAAGRIDVTLEPSTRTIRIRDNGTGLEEAVFTSRLTAFGASAKRHRQRRGFRGVGRLAGLGYCRELTFRSQAEGERMVSELRWDCRLLRSLLRDPDFVGTLADAVRQATSHRKYLAAGPNRFFEVELRGVVRHGRDTLLDHTAVGLYLAEVAPIPFAPSFRHAAVLNAFLLDKGVRADLDIFVNGSGPLFRPHRDTIQMKPGVVSDVGSPEFFEVPGLSGFPSACGWVTHHGYLGAIPRAECVHGVRLRSGNIQVGDHSVLIDLFPEPRFNAWTVAEVHILDRNIVPNGRRDAFEQSAHFENVVNHLAPLARNIAAQCRANSQRRQILRNASQIEERIVCDLLILKQGAITPTARLRYASEITSALMRIEKIAQSAVLSAGERDEMIQKCRTLSAKMARVEAREKRAKELERLSPSKRRAFEEIFSLVYECSTDTRMAKELIQCVLARIL